MTATASTLTTLPTGTWTIDPKHTEVGFVARHLMVTKVRGSFSDVEGTIVATDPIEDSTAIVTIQTGTLESRSADRDGHLKSPDFFDVETHPTMTFSSTAFDGDTLAGDLTIKGVTRPVTFEVEYNGVTNDPWGNLKAGFEASTTVNRKDWGLNWNAALEGGGVLVSDKVQIVLDVQLLKSA